LFYKKSKPAWQEKMRGFCNLAIRIAGNSSRECFTMEKQRGAGEQQVIHYLLAGSLRKDIRVAE
jgi:hypothetical protein